MIVFTPAKILVRMSISEGGSRNAFTPINTAKLNSDSNNMMGPYTMIDIFSAPCMLNAYLDR